MHAVRRDEFTRFVIDRSGALRRTAFLLCGDWHGAEDILQTALAKLYVAWPRVRRADAVDAYTRKVVVRTFLDERRRFWRREVPTEAIPDAAGVTDQPEDRLTILSALAQVPPRQRAVLILRFWEDLSVEQAAHALGCSAGTVKSQTARGLDTLRTHLELRGITSPALEGRIR
jgi:RNA polymerase sigma-70 factor (sigma-E family)